MDCISRFCCCSTNISFERDQEAPLQGRDSRFSDIEQRYGGTSHLTNNIIEDYTAQIHDIAHDTGPLQNSAINLISNCFKIIIPKSNLPKGLLGEEHICAMLYQTLIADHKRKDVIILLIYDNELKLPESFENTRFVIVPLSVNNNTHNTGIVIDRENKEWAYLDSYNGSCSEEHPILLNKRGLIDNTFNQVIFSNKTKQNDGWSCGLHVVENSINYVTGNSKKNVSDGIALWEKYKNSFHSFSTQHGEAGGEKFTDARLARRQKIRLRDGLEGAGANSSNHAFHKLWSALKSELDVNSDFREDLLSSFSERYSNENPNDAHGLFFLREIQNPGTDLCKNGLDQSTDENFQKTTSRQNAITNYINGLNA